MSITTRKPLGWFKPVPQIRVDLGPEPDLINLGNSMKKGQISPVGAFTDGEPLYGFRRLKAASLVGLEELLVTIYENRLDESAIKCIQFAENIHRLDMSSYEKWRACEDLRQINRSWSVKDLADYLDLSASAVTKLLSPSKCTPAWQDALKAGEVNISDCYPASQAPAEQQMRLLDLKRNGANREALSRAVQRTSTEQVDRTSRSSRLTIPLPSGVRLTATGKSMSLPELVDVLAEALDAAKKGVREHLDARTWQSVMRDKCEAVKGGKVHA